MKSIALSKYYSCIRAMMLRLVTNLHRTMAQCLHNMDFAGLALLPQIDVYRKLN